MLKSSLYGILFLNFANALVACQHHSFNVNQRCIIYYGGTFVHYQTGTKALQIGDIKILINSLVTVIKILNLCF